MQTEEYATLAQKKRSETMELYKLCIDTRKLELSLFWQRSLFFWGFIAATFIAYVELSKEESPLTIVLSGFGIVSSLVWYLANRGSKWWHENWETKVRFFEKELGFDLFSKREPSQKKWPKPLSSLKYSVTKLTIALSLFVCCVWSFIFMYSVIIYLIPKDDPLLETALIVLGILFAIALTVIIILIARARISPEQDKYINGKYVRQLRKERNISIEEMARELGLSTKAYAGIERKFFAEHVESIQAIADKLGVSAEYLRKS